VIYVMFGNQRHASIYALRKNLDPKQIRIATRVDALRGVNGSVTAIRLPQEVWKPTTFSCENRVKEAEQELKRIKQGRGIVIEEEMAL
jgi:hypothetical protein